MKRRCASCEHLIYPEYESDYSVCEIFGEEVPQEYATDDDEGCKCHEKTLKRLLDEKEAAIEREHAAYVDWFLNKEQGNENRID